VLRLMILLVRTITAQSLVTPVGQTLVNQGKPLSLMGRQLEFKIFPQHLLNIGVKIIQFRFGIKGEIAMIKVICFPNHGTDRDNTIIAFI